MRQRKATSQIETHRPGDRSNNPACNQGAAPEGCGLLEAQAAQGGGNSMALSFLAELDAGQNGSDGYGHEADGLSGMHQWVDRIDAQLELADRFEIIDDDMVGIMPNQVSQAEFEQIATLYSDVRRGSTNLQIDDTGLGKEDAASFQAQAMSDIADMLTTESGRGLVDDLAYGTVDGRDETTLITKSANPQSAGTEPAFGEKWSESIDGTGVSTNVFYGGIDLDMADSHPDYATAPYRQSSSDTVLFHELSHALHMRNGELAGTVGVIHEPVKPPPWPVQPA
jgi:hypothetical protein